MKKILFLTKMLLAVVLLCVGQNAWATNYSGSVSFTAKNRITNNGDGTFTTASNAGNQYALAIADLSGLDNIASATSVTLEFDVTIGGRLLIGIGDKSTRGTTANGSNKSTYNEDGLVMRYGTSDGTYVRVNGGTNNSYLLNTSSHVRFTLDRVTGKYSYTITYVDGESVTQTGLSGSDISTSVSNATIVEAYTWVSNQTFAISDVSYSYEYTASSFDYTVKAVDSESNVLSTLASGTSTEAVTVSYPRAIKVGEVWYVCPSTNNFSVEATSLNANPTITYTPDESIIYFKEAEDITSSQNVSNVSCSGGVYVNYYGGPTSVTIPVTGTYELETNVASRNANSSLEVYTADGTTSVAAIAKNGSLGVRTCQFDAEAGSMRVGGPYYSDKFQNSLGFDYVLVRLKSVSKEITSAGWATYCSPYALDLANATGLTNAYIVTGATGSVLSTTSVKDGTIPANTGILIEAPEGTVTIPVVASSSTNVEGNELVGVTVDTPIVADAGYVLMGSPKVGFYQNANAFTVGANTAYLPASFAAGARSAYFFGGDITGVDNVEAAAEAKAQNGKFIENGKLVIVKNGQKFNAAGQQVK